MDMRDPEFDAREPGRRWPLVRLGAIGEAWGLMQERWGTWALTTLVVILANAAVSGVFARVFGVRFAGGVGGFRWGAPRGATAISLVLSAIITGFFVGGMFRMACRQVRGQAIRLEDVFSVVDVLGELALGSALYALAVSVASLFCFLPALIVHGLLMFTLPLIVDAGLPAPAAIGGSWNALKGQWLMASVFHLVVSFFSGIGSCLCCVGLLVTAPLYVLSIAVLYRDFFPGNAPVVKSTPTAYPDF